MINLNSIIYTTHLSPSCYHHNEGFNHNQPVSLLIPDGADDIQAIQRKPPNLLFLLPATTTTTATTMKASTTTSPSLFLFLMRLAWRCRLSVPLLLSGSVALLGHAWMLQVSVHTVPRIHEREVSGFIVIVR
ncbi:hypothetical protein JYU34_001450 [Plutella xylostella]|uniref:Uncharacterized protein n=1 Tax=Plutella xylostella TaxID=51655 RepID=A0ABQ7R3Z3_PLUXY|nr:hypothetical protein JYU34_001450 [Plutella xylostella]